MTRVLVVHHDPDAAEVEVEELRRAGYEVEVCAGPTAGGTCPVWNGESCWQVEWADVLVYDLWASGDRGPELIEEIRSLHPGKPLVITSAPAFVGVSAHGADGPVPARSGMVEPVAAALAAASQSTARVGDSRHAAGRHTPTW